MKQQTGGQRENPSSAMESVQLMERNSEKDQIAAVSAEMLPMVQSAPAWVQTAAVVWAIGALLALAVLGGIYLMALKNEKTRCVFLRQKQGHEDGFCGLDGYLEAAKQSVGMNGKVSLLLASDETVPYALGIFRRKVVLPRKLALIGQGDLSERNQLKHVLLHELVHIKRRDNLKKMVSLMLLCIHWFNPFMWAACICFQRDIELACDEKVIAVYGEKERKAYAASLLAFADGGGKKNMRAFASFGESGAKSRIKNILYHKKTSKQIAVVTLGLVFCLCIGFMTNPIAKAPQESQRMIYAANDGLYCMSLGEAPQGEPVKLVDGKGISKPVFSEDGTAAAFMQNEDLYSYGVLDQKLSLLAEDAISFCSEEGNRFFVSTRADGIVATDADGKKDVILPSKMMSNGWIQYENISLSPDKTKLAFAKKSYQDIVRDTYGSFLGGEIDSLGVWICDMTSNDKENGLKQIHQEEIQAEEPFQSMPYPGKWSGDSERLFIWQDLSSASTHADGIEGSVYDLKTGQLIRLNQDVAETEYGWAPQKVLLAYDENVQFTAGGQLVLLNGGGRDQFVDKALQRITFGSKAAYETLKTPGLAPATPKATADGSTIYFAAAKALEGNDWNWDEVYPMHRQLYSYKDGKVTQLTKDAKYTCESPILSKDESQLIFGRIDQSKNMSIWKMNVDGSGIKKLADLSENTQLKDAAGGGLDRSKYPHNYEDYYGRGSWYDMIALY